MQKDEVTGLILAGGRGSRMGGVDKGLQFLNGEPMVLHAMKRLSPQVGKLMINANQNLETYRQFGVEVHADALQGFAGPLAGLQAGLMHCSTRYLVTAPCDSPFLPADLVARLGSALLQGDADLSVAVTESADATEGGPALQAHPVFCLLKASLLPHLTEFLQSGQRKIDKWYASLRVQEVHFPDEDAFSNINTVDELKKWEGKAE